MRAHSLAPRAAAAAALSLVALGATQARAADVAIQADTALQAYAVTSPYGPEPIARRRALQTLGLDLENLQGRRRPGEAEIRLVLLLRLDADVGINAHLPSAQAGGETTYAVAEGARYLPGLQVAPLDVMYGYLEARNLAHGLLGVKLGRQYLTDMLGFWSFDGALARLTTPFYVQAEMYGGLEQRGGLPLSTARYEPQGMWRGSFAGPVGASAPGGAGSGQPLASDYPSFQRASMAPAFGFALESAGPSFAHARVSYRRVYNTGDTVTQQFPDPGGGYRTAAGTRLSQERIGIGGDLQKRELGALRGGFSVDLYSQLVATYYAGVEAYLGKRATIGADIDYFVPVFDADAIWNWFTRAPLTTITGRASIVATRRLDFALSLGGRLFGTEGDPLTFGAGQCTAAAIDCSAPTYVDPSAGAVAAFSRAPESRAAARTADAVGDVNARYRFGAGVASLRGVLQAGASGSREGCDLAAERALDGGRFTLGARLSFYAWHDPTRPERDAGSLGYMFAFGFKPLEVARFRLELEHDMNRLVGQRFRLFGLVNLRVSR